MEVGAVDREVGSAVVLLGALSERQSLQPAAGEPVIEPHGFGSERRRPDRVENAEFPQSAGGIRAELNAGPGLFSEPGALEHLRLDAAAPERDSGSEPADAPAGDEDPLLPFRHVSRLKPPARRAERSP